MSAIKTYRYLRLGVVGMSFALAVALTIEILWGDSQDLGSISAYYYTPVVGIFVGVLMTAGFALFAIKGREGGEDIMLNLAGMLAPVVALVPTPISQTIGDLETTERAIPSELVPTVENNMMAMLALGVVGILAACWFLSNNDDEAAETRRDAQRGVVAGAAVFLLLGGWFFLDRGSFLDYGHYFAAVPMFALLAAVAVVNATQATRRTRVRGLNPGQFSKVYAVIAVATSCVLVAAVALFLLQALEWVTLPGAWLFWVEALVLFLFAAFWVAQTFENWDVGTPVLEAPGGTGTTTLPDTSVSPDDPPPAADATRSTDTSV